MRVKQYKGTVYGAELTAKERRAMNIEINRQIVEAEWSIAAVLKTVVLRGTRHPR